ncbi:MAG TPA: hypothetical protein V6D22_26210 [Candidatus Obscuribacterales bacterium]
MTILDEKESSVSLKLIVVLVSLATCAAFAGLFAMNAGHSAGAPPAQATAQTGNI